jgi:hypothetical protein
LVLDRFCSCRLGCSNIRGGAVFTSKQFSQSKRERRKCALYRCLHIERYICLHLTSRDGTAGISRAARGICKLEIIFWIAVVEQFELRMPWRFAGLFESKTEHDSSPKQNTR